MPWTARYALMLLANILTSSAFAGWTNNIMLTGYWPPTGDAIRSFSTSPVQNPDGWIGENWENRGYDVYSYFPQFDNFPLDRQGYGDFPVDYQETSEDWWRITAEINPVAIITFSAGAPSLWEVEFVQRNLARRFWEPDYEFPLRPTNDPPDQSAPAGFIRESTLPMEAIVDNVNAAGLDSMLAVVDYTNFGGAFLSEYIAYHGTWYQDLHSDPNDPFRNVAAGHIHVGPNIPTEDARIAAEISLRTLIDHIDMILVPEPSSSAIWSGAIIVLIVRVRRGSW